MICIEGPNENNVLTVTASGKLRKSDYIPLLPRMEELVKSYGKLNFFIKLEGFTGFELGAMWEDIKLDIKYKDNYGKIAIVGEKKWEKWGAKISGLFFSAPTKFFYSDKSDQAWQWINSE
jgi:hypothetical protein